MDKIFKIFGVIFFVVGIIIIFTSFQGITGFAIYEDIAVNPSFIIGAWFILAGILLIIYKKELRSKL